MEWNTNQSRLPYHLYTYREELRRRRRREGLLQETKTAISDQIVMNHFEDFYQLKREEALKITEVDIELEDCPISDCNLSEKEDCENTSCSNNNTNTNWDFNDMTTSYINSNLTKNNECLTTNRLSENRDNETMKSDDGITNYMNINWSLDDMLKEIDNAEMKSGSNLNNTKNANECDFINEICNDFNINLDDVFQNNSEFQMNTNSTNFDASPDLYMALEDFNNYYINF